MVASFGRCPGLRSLPRPLAVAAVAACLLWPAIAIVPGAAEAGNTKAATAPRGDLKAGLPLKGAGKTNGDPLMVKGLRATKAGLTANVDKALCDACLRGSVGCEQTVAGSLAPGDCTLEDGSYVDGYRIELPEARRVSVNLSSASFDTYLFVMEGDCSDIIADNDDCDGTNSCLDVHLSGGAYFIFANSYEGGESGSYRLEVTCHPPLCEDCVRGSISCGQTVAGSLAPGDCGFGDGSYLDIFRFDVERPGVVTIHMSSTRFDTYLLLASADCQTIDGNDDCGGTSLSCLTTLLAPGTYFIFANSYGEGETGDYELQVTECECPGLSAPHDPFPPEGALNVPTTTSLAWNGASAPAAKNTGRYKIIYGADDRRDEYQVTDEGLLSVGDSTVALVPRSALTVNGDGTYSLPATSFARNYADRTGRPLCADEPFRAQPVAAFCSGALVDSQLVFTAGHCITGSPDCADVAFVFGYVMSDAATPVLRVPASEVYFCAGILARQQADADWALIRLDRPVTGHRPLAVRREGSIGVGERIVGIGHPVGLPRKYDAGGTVRDGSSPEFFQANLDAYGGNSGSAVLNRDTLEVEGVLVRGIQDFVAAGACDRSNRCPDNGCPGWEDVTRATAFSSLLPAFDLYLGRNADALELKASGLGASWFEPGPLAGGVTYYWYVAVKNSCAEVRGPLWSFTTAGGGEAFLRGDANGDSQINIGDAIFTLGYLFARGAAPRCLDAADANDSGTVDISDAVSIIRHLFARTGPLPQPFGSCGIDPTIDGVDCISFPPCAGP